jgi:hypothetical protein
MNKKALALWVVGAVIAVLAVWGFIEGRKELARELERERPVAAPSRVVSQPEGTAVVLDAATQKRADIAVAAVAQTIQPREVEALASVLSPQELIDLRNNYVSAKAQLDKARAALDASSREYERLKALHNDDRNISDKTLQAAEASWRGDEAAERAAQAGIDAIARSAQQKWGRVLASAVADNSPLFQHLSERREVLLRVAAPSGTRLPHPPAMVRITAGGGTFRMARLISPSPQVDPRIQGPTFFYAAPAEDLLVGTTLAARLPIGPQEAGAVVPAAAVVWWQGKAWVYFQSAPDRFVRRELVGAVPVAEGWLVPGLSPAQIVVRGAQTLLSEELRAQIQVSS